MNMSYVRTRSAGAEFIHVDVKHLVLKQRGLFFLVYRYVFFDNAVFGSLCREPARRVALLTLNAMGKAVCVPF